ncbi:hypothetical protein C1752_01858 [Acaryochloris thomasi RCC1774]|uniref:Uncharacterized protein n=2 Tax=Acaryochloris TaxID=155977 RepID=A0A2W1JTY1_9CYAN|nr:hypothetical protein C1752_01858 [Acaryochloris thomasi RCC1774]
MSAILCGVLWLSMGLGQAAQATESSNQSYFLNEIETDRTMLVSPNFDGDLSLQPLWESLGEIGETYDVKGAQVLYSNWPNVREVPRLLVQVEPKASGVESTAVVADSSSITGSNPG